MALAIKRRVFNRVFGASQPPFEDVRSAFGLAIRQVLKDGRRSQVVFPVGGGSSSESKGELFDHEVLTEAIVVTSERLIGQLRWLGGGFSQFTFNRAGDMNPNAQRAGLNPPPTAAKMGG